MGPLRKTIITLVVGLTIGSSPVVAQRHYQGHQGIQAAYSLWTSYGELYSIGYQRFLDNRFQLEFNAGYQRGAYRQKASSFQYDANATYEVENYFLHETVDYTLLRAFKCLYLNLGIGLTQTYQQAETTSYTYKVDSVRLANIDNPVDFDPAAVSLSDQLRVGGHANLLAELYLSRYVTLLARHRWVYLLSSNYENWEQQTSAGLRINF